MGATHGTQSTYRGGVASTVSPAQKLFRAFLCLILCLGLSVSTEALSAASSLAWAEDAQPSIESLESDHDYASNTDKTWTYTWSDAATYGMAVTFDDQTKTESGWDYIYLYDGADNLLGSYSGTQLAGKTVYVPQSGTFKIRLTSDSSTNSWGFKVTSVQKLASNDLSLISTIDPISPQLLTAGSTAPEPVVHYGVKTLVKGSDYTVSYEGNTACGTNTAKVIVTGTGIYTGSLSRSYSVYDASNPVTGPTVTANQQVQLRQSGDTGSANVSLTGADLEWANVVTGITVTAVTGNDQGTTTTLDASQYTVNGSTGRITFTRTETAPVFSVAVGEGSPLVVTNRKGETITYPQSKQYEITIKATGYSDVVGTVTFYTGAADTFSIIVDEDGDDKTTADRTVMKTFTKAEIESMSTFQNGSSQCGMTGFRTFSAKGVALSDLIEKANVTVSEKDSFKLDTTDSFGRTWTYSQLFGERYFLASIYTDADVKATYEQLVKSDDQAGATIELRKLLASKAKEQGTIAKPMMSANYRETMISSDEVKDAVLPTEANTKINQLVGAENQYRFTYGISLVREDATVTFDTKGGSDVAAQTVQTNLMTSTENTTIRSTYWNSALIIYRNAATPEEPDTNPLTITEPANPTRDGYTFDGWYTKDGTDTGDWGSKFDFTANNGTVDADTTLYAKWSAIPPTVYPIRYYLDGGTNSSLNPSTYQEGTTVTLYDAEKAGYTFGGWFLDSSYTQPVNTISASTTGTVYLYAKWVKSSKPNPNPDPTPTPDPGADSKFTDVDYSSWYGDAVTFVADKGIITGYTDASGKETKVFGVGDSLTRAQLVTIMWRIAEPEAAAAYSNNAANATPMKGVEDNAYYTAAANWAYAKGVVTGYTADDGSSTFGANDAITFEQMMTIMARYVAPDSYQNADASALAKFKDASAVSGWATSGVAWAAQNGLLTGSEQADGLYIYPQAATERERAAVIFYRAYQGSIL